MGVTKIEWTATPRPDGTFAPGYTFNPWRGCTKISPGCANCYAEKQSHRNLGVLGVWGDQGTRVIAAESYWRLPLKWDREAREAGERRRVFCASLADVFEDRPDLVAPRVRLYHLIQETPHLDWLLLTKRPENVQRFRDATLRSWAEMPCNVWLGVSVEDQQRADERIPLLLATPAKVRFLSVEPLLGPIDLTSWLSRLEVRCNCGATGAIHREGKCYLADTVGWRYGAGTTTDPAVDDACLWYCGQQGHWQVAVRYAGPNWTIIGGESGPHARPCRVEWVRELVYQCASAGVACFVKQLGAVVRTELHDKNNPTYRGYMDTRYRDPKGGDPAEWPEDLRVRQFPTA